MKKNAILFSVVDREDYWVTSGIVFKVENTNHYVDAYNEVKDKLERPEMIEHIIEVNCLDFDLFENDTTFKFVRTYYSSTGLYFVFSNDVGDEVEHRMTADFVLVD